MTDEDPREAVKNTLATLLGIDVDNPVDQIAMHNVEQMYLLAGALRSRAHSLGISKEDLSRTTGLPASMVEDVFSGQALNSTMLTALALGVKVTPASEVVVDPREYGYAENEKTL